MHAAVLPALELWLEDHGIDRILPDWSVRRRRYALAEDLAALGIASAPPLPPRFAFSEPGDADLTGAAYVLEGSRLGGRLLKNSMADQVDPLPTAFLGHGESDLWRGFVEAIGALTFSPSERQRALLAAHSVFTAYEEAFASAGPTARAAA